MVKPSKVVLATLGSLGDLNPCIGIALELKSRGHSVLLASSESYRGRIQKRGLDFHAIRPDLRMNKEMVDRVLADDGAEYFVRRVLIASLESTYQDLSQACANSDLLISGDLVLAAPLVAQKQRTSWISAVLSPSSFGSVVDFYPGLGGRVGKITARSISRAMNELARFGMRSWIEPIAILRRKLGLASDRHPLTIGRFSPQLVLGLFSSVLGGPHPDWPASTRVTGAIFYDEDEGGNGMSPEIEAFLHHGDPPLVFTLGSSAALSPGDFYKESARASRILGRRALLVMGKNGQLSNVETNILVCDYAPYSELFPRAAAVIHAAGAGSIAHALRAGCPMLLLPYGGFDQPMNAERLKRLGFARTIDPKQYRAQTAASEIACLLDNHKYADRARNTSRLVKSEDGLRVACGLIEQQMRGRPA